MSRKRSRTERERRSPTETVANLSHDFFDSLEIPDLPEAIPQRLEDAIRARVDALLFRLKEASRERYVRPLEVRLIRETHRAVLTAYELGLSEGEVYYAEFRRLVEALGYERTDVGFTRVVPVSEE